MKLNWGTGITIAIIAFMGFILFMVVKATNTKSDLYAEDYYQQEITYQGKIDALKRAKNLKGQLVITQREDQLTLFYPSDFEAIDVAGELHFFRPDNAALDQVFSIRASDNQQEISKEKLVAGWYNVKVDWTAEGKTYRVEQRIQID